MTRSSAHDHSCAAGRSYATATRTGGLTQLIGWWLARHRQRRDLRSIALFDDHLLKDIGLDRDAALGEARKPFWR